MISVTYDIMVCGIIAISNTNSYIISWNQNYHSSESMISLTYDIMGL